MKKMREDGKIKEKLIKQLKRENLKLENRNIELNKKLKLAV
jgi:hypothetical protein